MPILERLLHLLEFIPHENKFKKTCTQSSNNPVMTYTVCDIFTLFIIHIMLFV